MSGKTSPRHIGPYRLLSPDGAGAVRRAAGPDGRDVAIRLLPPGAAPDIGRMREVASPYVVDVLDGEPAGPQPYVVSRFVPGRPLGDAVAEHGPVSGDALRGMAYGLAKALAAIHRAGLAHGALGPETVLVVDDAPVVADFALTAGGDSGGGAADDVGAWAATVTFAATGRRDASAEALPSGLRPLVEAASRPDPRERPAAEELAEAASKLDLPARPAPAPGTGPGLVPRARPESAPAASAGPRPKVAGEAASARGVAAHEMRVALGWARLLTAMAVVIAVAVAIIAPVAGLAASLAAVTLLRLAAAPERRGARGWAEAFGRTLLTVPYAAACTVAVPVGLAAVAAAGGRIDSLLACAFGAGAGAAALWTAPGVHGPRRRLERLLLPLARRPRPVAAAVVGLGVPALLAVVGAMTLEPSFAPMYGLQQTLESSLDRLQHAVGRW